ncbi:origin recognition complex subunit [Culex quinquefasciatus]|uniref:Origin recognition complex subunit n=1 Tax=Culex quinquefasciatus TaxID=7176 RepID=B0WJA5_CULQU|nr:origin recognition complex subunit [Culex quinquefasciatus]|eukprot:XP_001848789.1 origin recognition complex subunit [Culex quinquefasciatus]
MVHTPKKRSPAAAAAKETTEDRQTRGKRASKKKKPGAGEVIDERCNPLRVARRAKPSSIDTSSTSRRSSGSTSSTPRWRFSNDRSRCVAPGMKRHRAKGRRRDEDSPKAILNRLTGHVPCAANGYASLASVDSMKDFVVQLARLSPSRSYIVVLENAERVRDMDHNVLPMLLRLPEVTGLNVCVVLVWDLPFEKYFVRTGLAPVVKLFVAEYSKKDILVILMNDFEAVLQACQLSEEEIDKRLKIVEMLTPDFFENYLNIFLNVFFKELQLVALECFHKYCEPMLDGTIARTT